MYLPGMTVARPAPRLRRNATAAPLASMSCSAPCCTPTGCATSRPSPGIPATARHGGPAHRPALLPVRRRAERTGTPP